MKFLCAVFFVFACVSGVTAQDSLRAAELLLPQHQHADVSGPALPLDEIERMALQDNPEIRVAARMLSVAETRIPAAGALDDPFFMYRGWGVPLEKPWDYNAAQNMFMIGQTFPGRGKRVAQQHRQHGSGRDQGRA